MKVLGPVDAEADYMSEGKKNIIIIQPWNNYYNREPPGNTSLSLEAHPL